MSDTDRCKWNARYATDKAAPTEPSRVLTSLAACLPISGTALDLAGGGGRHAVWLARRGLQVTIWDISHAGLAIAHHQAQAAGVKIATQEVDLENPTGLPTGKFNLVLITYYLNRSLLAMSHELLLPGGILAMIHPTLSNLERHDKPPAEFLLAEGELPTLVPQLRVATYQEGWLDDGRHDAVLVAIREPSS